MTYPNITDYRTALRNAPVRFATLEVNPVLDVNDDPVFKAGNFAAVFKASVSGVKTEVALKFFIRDLPNLEDRHHALAQVIEQTEARYLIDVGFLPGEIFVTSSIASSGEYPVVMMPWIDGENLGAVVNRFCAKGQRKGLAALTRAWANLCLDMLSKGIAHGDLKHDNVLVTPDGQLRLIDYDSMFVPSLKGSRSVLLGGASYQHPRRDIQHFDGNLDHFSILVIVLSLRALTLNPELHEIFHAGENIIFSSDDFTAVAQSGLIGRLRESPDALVRNWTNLLVKVSQSSSITVPRLGRVLQQARKATEDPMEGGRAFSFPFSKGQTAA
ncbi:MAG: protein kinase family protein [Rhodospirillales bacterium]